MAIYVTLIRYTERGIANIKDSPRRVAEAKEIHRSLGADMKEFYLTMGGYDAVSIAEAPDDTTMAKVLLALGGKGNVHTETLRAFSQDEAKNMISGLP